MLKFLNAKFLYNISFLLYSEKRTPLCYIIYGFHLQSRPYDDLAVMFVCVT